MVYVSILRDVAMVRFTGYKLYTKICRLDGLSNSRLSSKFWKLFSLLLTYLISATHPRDHSTFIPLPGLVL